MQKSTVRRLLAAGYSDAAVALLAECTVEEVEAVAAEELIEAFRVADQTERLPQDEVEPTAWDREAVLS